MLKQGTFIKNKYYKFLICNILNRAAYGINLMIDSIVGGAQLGETALTAVSIVSPIFCIVTFCSQLFSAGFAIQYGKAIGEFDKEHAYRLAGQSIFSSFAISAVMIVVLLTVKRPFLICYQCSGELLEQASAYFNWIVIYMAIYPINMTFYYLLVTDGDAVISMLSGIGEIVVNLTLSFVLSRKFGVVGLGIATLSSAMVSIVLALIHFLRKTNSIHFKTGWSWDDLGKAFCLSYSRSLNYLFIAIVDIIMNKIVLTTCGIIMIPAYSVINLVFSICYTNNAPYDSCAGFCATFVGERNSYGIRNVLRLAKQSVTLIGIALTVLCFFCAPYIPKIYGMLTPEVVTAAVKASRIMAFTAIPYGFALLGYSLYSTLEKPSLSMLIAFLNNLFCPLVLSIPFAYFWGFTGVSIGMSLSAFLVVGLFSLFVLKKYGKNDFPLYLNDYGEKVVGFDLCVEKDDIVLLRDNVSDELARHGYKTGNISLLIEELYTRILEKNNGKKILSECILLFGEKRVRIIIRDNGKIFNFVDENNQIESLNAYVLNCLLEQIKEKNYVLTTSFNRNGFIFEK